MSQTKDSSRTMTVLGWIAILLFVGIYAVELVPGHGPPVTVQWIRSNFGKTGLILANIIIVLAFLALLPYRKPTRHVWKSRGAFFAFVIALMTEMFGWPLFIFIASPLFEIPLIAPQYFRAVGHWPATVGTGLSIFGVVLIAFGWKQIHRATGLMDSGIYKYIRHPQYTGMALFTLGWILHWPSIITLLLWPFMMAAYAWLARSEERQALAEFGAAYKAYQSDTKRFIPGVW